MTVRKAMVLTKAPTVIQSMNHLRKVFLILSFDLEAEVRSSSPCSATRLPFRVKGKEGSLCFRVAGNVRSRKCCHTKLGGVRIKLAMAKRRRSRTSSEKEVYFPASVTGLNFVGDCTVKQAVVIFELAGRTPIGDTTIPPDRLTRPGLLTLSV